MKTIGKVGGSIDSDIGSCHSRKASFYHFWNENLPANEDGNQKS